MIRITDRELIAVLKTSFENHPDWYRFSIDGDSSDDIMALIQYAEKRNKEDDYFLRKYRLDDIHKFWRHLLTDAINILKWYDTREISDSYRASTEYKHWIAGSFGSVAFGIEALDKYFDEFIKFEQLLYGAERYYRDHFLHVIRVWLTGILIITTDGYLSIDDIIIDDPTANYFRFSYEERIAIWTIIALCHDLGYPLEKIVSINSPLRRMIDHIGKANVNDFSYEFPRQHQFIDDFIVRFISSKLRDITTDPIDIVKHYFKTDIQAKYYLKLSKSFEEQQHGILKLPSFNEMVSLFP